MSDPHADQPLPKSILLSAAALLTFALLAVGAVRLTGTGLYSSAQAPVTETRALLFVDRDEGGVAVVDATTRETVRVLQPGEDGFIRATVRTMAQERLRRGLSASTPFQLMQHADGRMTFSDPVTRRSVSLEAFGSTNRASFARLLAAPNS